MNFLDTDKIGCLIAKQVLTHSQHLHIFRLNINFNDEERKLDVKVFQDEDNSLENRLSAIR